jgi:hypothetical protein
MSLSFSVAGQQAGTQISEAIRDASLNFATGINYLLLF